MIRYEEFCEECGCSYYQKIKELKSKEPSNFIDFAINVITIIRCQHCPRIRGEFIRWLRKKELKGLDQNIEKNLIDFNCF